MRLALTDPHSVESRWKPQKEPYPREGAGSESLETKRKLHAAPCDKRVTQRYNFQTKGKQGDRNELHKKGIHRNMKERKEPR